jgi:hypothetical protein
MVEKKSPSLAATLGNIGHERQGLRTLKGTSRICDFSKSKAQLSNVSAK